MRTKSTVTFLIAGAGSLFTQVAAAAHPYGPVAQAGGLSVLENHPVLDTVVHLWVLVMAVIVGAVVVAALVRPSVR
jgi:hypothetical protein